uniref:Uncharacterized protein n=1 Tax=Panagrolaimus superbus TaxID=310955 RepID=A0A914YEJ4_9BILA
MEGTFPCHNHTRTKEFTIDKQLMPLPVTPISLPRVSKNGKNAGYFQQTMKLLDKTWDDLKSWTEQAELCCLKAEKFPKLMAEAQQLYPSMDFSELKKYLECIRLESK